MATKARKRTRCREWLKDAAQLLKDALQIAVLVLTALRSLR